MKIKKVEIKDYKAFYGKNEFNMFTFEKTNSSIMKRLLLILLILMITKISFSQGYSDYPLINGKIMYEKVFGFDSVKKETLHQYAVEYFAIKASNSNFAIKLNNKDEGFLLAKGIFANLSKMIDGFMITGNWSCTIQFDSKDERIRVRIFDLYKTTSYNRDGLPIEGINESFIEEKLNRTKRAGALSEEASHVNQFAKGVLN